MSSGGKGNSKSNTSAQTSTSTNTSTVNTVDNRAIQGDNATVGGNVTVTSGEGSQVSIQSTDLGAIAKGLDVALESISAIQQSTSSNTDALLKATENSTSALKSVTSDSISQAYGLANEARQSETSGAINTLTKYLFWIALAGIAVYGLSKVKGKL